jgi:hypothetical protein
MPMGQLLASHQLIIHQSQLPSRTTPVSSRQRCAFTRASGMTPGRPRLMNSTSLPAAPRVNAWGTTGQAARPAVPEAAAQSLMLSDDVFLPFHNFASTSGARQPAGQPFAGAFNPYSPLRRTPSLVASDKCLAEAPMCVYGRSCRCNLCHGTTSMSIVAHASILPDLAVTLLLTFSDARHRPHCLCIARKTLLTCCMTQCRHPAQQPITSEHQRYAHKPPRAASGLCNGSRRLDYKGVLLCRLTGCCSR